MRTLVCAASMVLALAVMGISALLSYRFTYTLGGSELEALAYASAAAAIDILKGFMPFLIALRLQEGRRRAAFAAACLLAVGVLWSFTSAMGLAAQNRMSTVGVIDSRQAHFRDATAELAKIEAAQTALGPVRAILAVTGEIERELAVAVTLGRIVKTVSDWTDDCRRPMRGLVDACNRIGLLRQDLARAREWQRLEAQATAQRQRIAELRQAGAGENVKSDVQADIIAKAITALTGQAIGAEWVRIALLVLVAVVLEVGSSCGLYAALGSHVLPHKPDRPRDPEPVQTANAASSEREQGVISAWCAARVEVSVGARTKMGDLFEDYGSWCAEQGLRTASRQRFLRELRAEGQRCGWSIAGGLIHGIAVRQSEAV